MHEDVAALKRRLCGRKITDITVDDEGMIIVEVDKHWALIPLMDVEGNGYGALQWLDLKSTAQGVIG